MGRGLDGLFFDTQSVCLVHAGSIGCCVVLKAREGPGFSPLSGGYGEGETPLPFPNRAVKPLSADGTWPERAWESRSPPVFLSVHREPFTLRGWAAFVRPEAVRRRACGSAALGPGARGAHHADRADG